MHAASVHEENELLCFYAHHARNRMCPHLKRPHLRRNNSITPSHEKDSKQNGHSINIYSMDIELFFVVSNF